MVGTRKIRVASEFNTALFMSKRTVKEHVNEDC
jgi:hypothetical protein